MHVYADYFKIVRSGVCEDLISHIFAYIFFKVN